MKTLFVLWYFWIIWDDFATVNAIYAEYFKESAPARSCVEVARLPKGGLIEIEAIAAK